MASVQVGGFTPITTIDYPDHLACVVYTQGCPLRCQYCQNPDLIPFNQPETSPSWLDIKGYLRRRIGIIEAVVFSGGEPTLQPQLTEVLTEVSAQGFKIGLHTAGVSFAALKRVITQLDWVGLDVKGLEQDYQKVTGRRHQWLENRRSLALLLASNVDFECRTTVDWRLTSPESLIQLAQNLSQLGVERYAVQINHGSHCLNSALQGRSFLESEKVLDLSMKMQKLFKHFEWRE